MRWLELRRREEWWTCQPSDPMTFFAFCLLCHSRRQEYNANVKEVIGWLNETNETQLFFRSAGDILFLILPGVSCHRRRHQRFSISIKRVTVRVCSMFLHLYANKIFTSAIRICFQHSRNFMWSSFRFEGLHWYLNRGFQDDHFVYYLLACANPVKPDGKIVFSHFMYSRSRRNPIGGERSGRHLS